VQGCGCRVTLSKIPPKPPSSVRNCVSGSSAAVGARRDASRTAQVHPTSLGTARPSTGGRHEGHVPLGLGLRGGRPRASPARVPAGREGGPSTLGAFACLAAQLRDGSSQKSNACCLAPSRPNCFAPKLKRSRGLEIRLIIVDFKLRQFECNSKISPLYTASAMLKPKRQVFSWLVGIFPTITNLAFQIQIKRIH